MTDEMNFIEPKDAEEQFRRLVFNDPLVYALAMKMRTFPAMQKEFLMIGIVMFSRSLRELEKRHQALLDQCSAEVLVTRYD